MNVGYRIPMVQTRETENCTAGNKFQPLYRRLINKMNRIIKRFI